MSPIWTTGEIPTATKMNLLGWAATYGTTPPGSPNDGDLWLFPADATNGVMWLFRYRAASASAYKWEFVGGTDLYAETAATDTTASGTVSNLANGPSLTLPRAGDWILEAEAVASSTGADVQTWLGVGDSAVATNLFFMQSFGQQPTAGRWATIHVKGRGNAIAANVVATVKAWTSTAATNSYQYRRLLARPVRIS